ncbi:MAG: hypothetical protein KA275_04970 [Chitinophagaceae bacterium]|nr:hypothetical protein [Chitinophagaceae bacterium]
MKQLFLLIIILLSFNKAKAQYELSPQEIEKLPHYYDKESGRTYVAMNNLFVSEKDNPNVWSTLSGYSIGKIFETHPIQGRINAFAIGKKNSIIKYVCSEEKLMNIENKPILKNVLYGNIPSTMQYEWEVITPPADLLKENNITEVLLNDNNEKYVCLKINNPNSSADSYFLYSNNYGKQNSWQRKELVE